MQVETKAESELILRQVKRNCRREMWARNARAHLRENVGMVASTAGWGPEGDDNGQKRMNGKSSLRRPVEIRPTFEPNRGRRNRVRTK
jgi:hypothetical protein